MNLKEAFHYQNYLETLLTAATTYLRTSGNVTKTTETHYRKKANPEAEDEQVEVATSKTLSVAPDMVIDFLMHVAGERTKLYEAISRAKAACGFDIDSNIAINKTNQQVKTALLALSCTKPCERTTAGNAFKLNVSGEQVRYYYEVKSATTIDYDRNKVRKLAKKLGDEADANSFKIDLLMLSTAVDYEPIYDTNDAFEDAVEKFAAAQKPE